ncbi:hypothetical protein QYE76_021200 [Lolium multiflorum]|uniref:Uncharacterized protein n=1 Tax=Lolium multiflorum TaxID=4521 RepID=A0AAD8R660_LOLMU|nr:hypothetical protein QYE76_021200 [Lolium multiflorum]
MGSAAASLNVFQAADILVGPRGKLLVNSSADALSMAIESGNLIRALLQKNKGVMSRLHAMIFSKDNQEKSLEQLTDAFTVDTEGTIEVTPVPSFVEGSSANVSENDQLQRMKTRILQMEKDMCGIHAMAAIIKKKGEIAIDAKRYALGELQKTTESLNFIALNLSEENKRVHERVDALTSLAHLMKSSRRINRRLLLSQSFKIGCIKFTDSSTSVILA